MRPSLFGLALLAWCASSAAASADDNQLAPQEKAKGWMLLFEGKTLDGWMK